MWSLCSHTDRADLCDQQERHCCLSGSLGWLSLGEAKWSCCRDTQIAPWRCLPAQELRPPASNSTDSPTLWVTLEAGFQRQSSLQLTAAPTDILIAFLERTWVRITQPSFAHVPDPQKLYEIINAIIIESKYKIKWMKQNENKASITKVGVSQLA